ncbi:MAG: aminoglycoside phosphotransferase family protein [Actinomycetota bacterium]
MANRPEAEIDVSENLVRALLHEQAPGFEDQPLALVDRGWDNTNWRLGNGHMIRVPHRAVAAPLIELEQQWLPDIADRLDIAVPAPLIHGHPSEVAGFPWPWSVVPWIEGHDAERALSIDEARSAERLGTFFAQLHTPAVPEAPTNPYRGGPLADRRRPFEERLGRLGARIDGPAARRIFDEGARAPAATDRLWLHGDLHARNMIVSEGLLAGVVDWGDLCAGDRATDLAGAFMLVPGQLDLVASRANADDAAWERARGWAIHFAITYLAMSDDEPKQRRVGGNLLGALGVGCD